MLHCMTPKVVHVEEAPTEEAHEAEHAAEETREAVHEAAAETREDLRHAELIGELRHLGEKLDQQHGEHLAVMGHLAAGLDDLEDKVEDVGEAAADTHAGELADAAIEQPAEETVQEIEPSKPPKPEKAKEEAKRRHYRFGRR